MRQVIHNCDVCGRQDDLKNPYRWWPKVKVTQPTGMLNEAEITRDYECCSWICVSALARRNS